MNEHNNGNGAGPVLLDKAAIFAAAQVKTRDIQACGGTVRIKELSAAQVAELSDRVQNKNNNTRAMAIWVCASVIDESGACIFSQDDEEAVMQLGAQEVLKIGREVLALNGLTDLEAQVKNSGAQSIASNSA
jgi:hypothetical protein